MVGVPHALFIHCFLPLLCDRLVRRIGGIKGKDCRLRYENFTGISNEIKN